jgi:ABC-2 type transport system permease protein
MIRSSFAAVPRRSVVVLAKALVFAGVVFVVSIAAVVPAFVIGETVRSGQVRAALHTPGVPRAIIAAAVYLTVLGLLAVGLGFLIRSTAGAVSTLFATVFAAPMLALFLPYPTSAHLGRLLPFNALLQAITTDRELNLDSFGPWQGIAVMGAWALLAMSAGLFLVLRRNA